jgi:hypothetical protein
MRKEKKKLKQQSAQLDYVQDYHMKFPDMSQFSFSHNTPGLSESVEGLQCSRRLGMEVGRPLA